MLGKTNITTLSEGAIVTEVEDFKWIQMQSGVHGNFVKAIYKNDYLVAITADGTVVYTTDGEVWQVSVLEYEDCKLNDIEWDGNRFLLVGSYTVGNEETALLLITNDFINFSIKEIFMSNFHKKEYFSIYHVNRKYIVICRSRKSEMSATSEGGLYVYIGDLEGTWEKQILIEDSYCVKESISIAHNSDGILLYFKYYYAIDGSNYLYKIDINGVCKIKEIRVKSSLPDIKVFECKDNLLYMFMRSEGNYRLTKVLNTNEEILLSADINYGFVDGVYFNGCELFINNHEMLVVKKGESVADKTLDDLIEIAPELTMNCITKAFGQLFIFGNQGAILKSSVETNNESAITVQTISAKKALSDAKQYADTKIADSSCFQPGDVVNLSPNLPFAGYITGGKTQIICTIPLDKITEGRTVNIEGTLTVRGMQEYVLNRVELSDYNISITPTHNFLRLIIENKDKSAFSGNNNCPLAISFEYGLKITFS